MCKEFRQVSREADFMHHVEHSRADLRDFGEADGVDFFGWQIGCHEFADLGAVVRLAIRQRVRGERSAGARQVFGAQEFQQLRVGRNHRLANGRRALFAQRFHERGRKRAGKFLEGPVVDDVRGRARGRDLRDPGIAAGQCHCGRREPARGTRAHVDDLLIEVARHVAQQGDVFAILLLGSQVLARDFREVAPEAAVRIERLLVVAKALLGEQRFDLLPVHRVVDANAGAEIGRRDRPQLPLDVRPAREFRGLGCRPDVG